MSKSRPITEKIAHYLIPRRSNNYRPQLLHAESILVLAIASAGFFSIIQTVRFFPTLQNSILGFATNISIEAVVEQTNQKRAEQGMAPLTLNTELSAAALAKAQDMFDNQYWAHTSPTGKQPWDFIKAANYRYKVAGENLARDFYNTSDMVSAWMNSPTHRDNIMNPQYQQIGIAVVNGRLEGFETTLVVQMFGTPAGVSQVVDASEADSRSLQEQPQPSQNESSEHVIEQSAIHNPLIAVAGDEDGPHLEVVRSDQLVTSQPGLVSADNLLSSAVEPLVHLGNSPLFTPLQLTKIVFLAIIMLVILTLAYDSLAIGNKKNMRMVGHNLAHIILFVSVAFLMILFKGGVVK